MWITAGAGGVACEGRTSVGSRLQHFSNTWFFWLLYWGPPCRVAFLSGTADVYLPACSF